MHLPKSRRHYHVDWESPITLPCLTERLHEEGLGTDVLKDLLEHRDDELADEWCGPRYEPDPTTPYRRAGTRDRTLTTRLGTITVTVTRVQDTETGTYTTPLWDDVEILANKTYQEDVTHQACQLAERLSYRDAHDALARFVDQAPSPSTINRRVIARGHELSHQIHHRELTATTHQVDGTKLHEQGQHNHLTDLRLSLATTATGPPRLRSLTAGASWSRHQPVLERTVFETPEGEPASATVVTDLERGLADTVTPEDGHWQPCLIHVVDHASRTLWQDGLPQNDDKQGYLDTLARILQHLRNSLNRHLPEGNPDRVRHRIRQTTKEIRRLATRLAKQDCPKTAGYLRRVSAEVTTFAHRAVQGVPTPWHNNRVERLMGTISKRCKHEWMTWTAHGSQALVTLLVVHAIEPGLYERFWEAKLYGEGARSSGYGVSITRGAVGT